MNLIYVPFVGLPLCIFLMAIGCMFCLTIVLIPVGLACFALGFQVVTLKR